MEIFPGSTRRFGFELRERAVKHTRFPYHIKATFCVRFTVCSMNIPSLSIRYRLTLLRCAGAIALTLAAGPTRVAAAQSADSTLVARFQLAESYLRSAQFERAISILEDLTLRSPEIHVFYERLRKAYETLKRYDDAITLVDKRVRTEAVPAIYITEKARLLYLKGDDDLARETWQRAVAGSANSPSVYLLVYRSLMQVRLFDFAIEILEQGRSALENRSLFRTDLAYLYSLTSDHGNAMAEYLHILDAGIGQFSFVRARLDQFIRDDGALKVSLAVVEGAVARSPLNRSYRELLAWLYVEAGKFEDALAVNRAIDRLEDEAGSVLFAFARIASEAGAFDVAADSYSEVLERHPDSPSAPEALRGLGLMQEQWASLLGERVFDEFGLPTEETRYHAALATYEKFLQDFPEHVLYPDVLRRIGHLQQSVFYDLDAARDILSEVIARYPRTVAADDAAFDMGRLMLQDDDLINAQVQFSRIVSRLRTGDMADKARFELSLLHFYRGEFDAALLLTSAMQENTSSNVANDAIELKLLLIENRGPDSLDVPLKGYARAMLLKRQRRNDRALDKLDFLLDRFGGHPLADDIRFVRAEIFRVQGKTGEALQAFLELPLIHPSSFLADRSLFTAADIQACDLGDTDAAVETFTRLLKEHPQSLLLPEVRQRIRRLRGDEV